MQPIYFTAGPSQLHSNYIQYYKQAMENNIGSLNHRSAEFRKIYENTDAQLRKLLNLTPNHFIFFTASATEIWERMILNLVEQNSFHFVNGSFSQKFFDFSTQLGKNAIATISNHGNGFDFENCNIPQNTELICTTQNETSSGVCIPPHYLNSIKQKNKNALLCTDIVSIAPISNIDYNVVDSSFFSVQKAFGMPAGLGVWIVNNKCIEKSKEMEIKNIKMGAHQTIQNFYSNYLKWETPSTPNVVAIYILGKIAENFNTIGIENIRNEINLKAKLIYDFANENKNFTTVVKDVQFLSPSVIVLNCNNGSEPVIAALKQKGIFVTSGYGKYKAYEIRIANFPNTSMEDMKKLIFELENCGK